MNCFKIENLRKNDKLKSILFILFMVVFNIFLFNNYSTIYYLIIDAINISLGLISLFLSIITYKININKKFLFVGLSFGFISLLNWISISDLIIDIDYNSLMQISISLKYIITISFISTIFISKKVHMKNSILYNFMVLCTTLYILF